MKLFTNIGLTRTLPTTHEIKTNNKAYSKPPNGFPWRWMTLDKKLNFQFDPGIQYQYSGEGGIFEKSIRK
jgi:hypothetical protein